MAMNTSAPFPDGVEQAILLIENGDGTGAQDLVTGDADGTKIDQLFATTDDTADVELYILVTDGTATQYIGRVTVPDGSGYNGTDGIFDILDELGLSAIWLKDADWKIQVAAQTAVTAAKKCWVHAVGQTY